MYVIQNDIHVYLNSTGIYILRVSISEKENGHKIRKEKKESLNYKRKKSDTSRIPTRPLISTKASSPESQSSLQPCYNLLPGRHVSQQCSKTLHSMS